MQPAVALIIENPCLYWWIFKQFPASGTCYVVGGICKLIKGSSPDEFQSASSVSVLPADNGRSDTQVGAKSISENICGLYVSIPVDNGRSDTQVGAKSISENICGLYVSIPVRWNPFIAISSVVAFK
ncbi:hypothetical protein QE152_g39375 [Popillia japonica]|uniref:Uncharacterized protein n=1 Tax=Popillia japonica TaxID=7064 RepID=A0AAW1HTY3_POPJA